MNPCIDDLRSAIEWACQPTYIPYIEKGRGQILAMPKASVLENFDQVAFEALNLSDFWEYRRLLELAELLDPGLLRRFVPLDLGNPDPDVHEAAEEYEQKLSALPLN